MDKISIVIAEDHKVVRSGLKRIIDSEPDMEVIGEAGDGLGAIRIAQDLAPDILILDISLPTVSGLEVAKTVHRTLPSVKILTLTQHSDRAYLRELLSAGISGYVLKQSESGEMLRAIRQIAKGRQYLDPDITASVFEIVATSKAARSVEAPTSPLTIHESDVLRHVARGYSNREIADKLETSLKTIEMRKASALKKLNIRSRSQIVDYGILHGWFNGS